MSEASVLGYVNELDLPDAGPQYEGLETSIPFKEEAEVVAVGAQIAEFSAQVSPELRAAVSDCLLLAQLAANKATDGNPDVIAWYRKYVEVLQNVGWTVQSMNFQRQELGNLGGDVHSAIIPVVTAMLGPAVATASLVVAVLKGLQEMDKDKPWITVFDRATQHASGAKLQLGFVGVDANGRPTMRLLALAIDAQRSVTQVLFFKFSDQRSTLQTAEGELGIESTKLDLIKGKVADKVQPFLLDFISQIEL